MSGDRYTIDFDLSVIQPNSPQSSQLSGSIFTPLGHYTVMGTTTFVDSPLQTDPKGPAPMKQHASAFIMYLDKAPEYPAKATQAEKKDH